MTFMPVPPESKTPSGTWRKDSPTGGDIAILEDARRFDRGKNYLAELKASVAVHVTEIGKAAGWRAPGFAAAGGEALPFTSLSGLFEEVDRARAEEQAHLARSASGVVPRT